MKLNLGCGDKKIEGYLNVDVCGAPDLICDLSAFPWPWEDNSVDEVFSEHFLEHVPDYEKTVLEMHRVLAPQGILRFKVPHFRSPMAVWHLHRHQFSTYTPELLCECRPYQWCGRHLFEKVSLRINYVWVNPLAGKIFGFLANRAPGKWDWLGFPIDEIEFTCRKKTVLSERAEP